MRSSFTYNGDGYPDGIQFMQTTESDLHNQSCSLCFDKGYWESIRSDEILACDGTYLFVGAKEGQRKTFSIGAYGLASEIHQQTEHNRPHSSNGLYWYFTSGWSFGFADTGTILQRPGDTGTAHPRCRLSWLLDISMGGYRVGTLTNLTESTAWRKVIYNCPPKSLHQRPVESYREFCSTETTPPPPLPALGLAVIFIMIAVIYASLKRKKTVRERRQMEDHLEQLELKLKIMTAQNRGNSVGYDTAAHFETGINVSYGDANYEERLQEELEISEHDSLLGGIRKENANV